MTDSSRSPAPTLRTERAAGIEWLRIAGSVAIVFFHAHAQPENAFLAGLTIFSIVTTALACRSAGRKPAREFIASRAGALLVPWAFWWLVYAGVEVFFARLNHAPLFAWFHARMLVSGPAIHLWFLPFAFGASVCALAFQRITAKMHRSLALACVLFLVGAAAILAAQKFLDVYGIMLPVSQWMSTLPAVILGLGLGLLPMSLEAPPERTTIAASLLLTIACAAAGAWVGLAGAGPYVGLEYLIAGACCSAGWLLPCGRAGRTTALLSSLCLGVYLAHPLFLKALSGRLGTGEASAYALGAAATVGALIVTLIMRKTPLRRFVGA